MRKENTYTLIVGEKTDATTEGISVTATLRFNPTVPLLGIYQKDSISYYRDNCISMSVVASVTTSVT